MNPEYEKHVAERAEKGLPPLALDKTQTAELCGLLCRPGAAPELAELLAGRVVPGVDPAAEVKAKFLLALAQGEKQSPVITPEKAVELLGTMNGGYNVKELLKLLDPETAGAKIAEKAADALSRCILIFSDFDAVEALRQAGNIYAGLVMESWARADWFTARPALPDEMALCVYKVDGTITTDDFSPAAHAVSRPDIPLHALAMGESLFPDALKFMADARARGEKVVFAGDTVGVGSSRKSATNSLIWHIGDDIPFVPNKRRGGLCLGTTIAPIFFNTFEDAGGLPIACDVGKLRTGMRVTVDFRAGKITGEGGEVLSVFKLNPATLPDEFRAGGRVPLIIGKALSERAAAALGLPAPDCFIKAPRPAAETDARAFTLAQKMVGRACGRDGVLPGETCSPKMTTVGSQDTTGPMTRDELTELACLKFSAPLFMQSFCHTAAYPKEKDKEMHRTLPGFVTARGGLALRPGDGIIHSWLNRLLLPDTVGTGGDSHTRFPLGISFPAGSGLVAFAAALGYMPLDMPESVLVKISGKLPAGLTLRDVVNYIPLRAVELGLQSEFGHGDKNVFNGRILEIEGLTRELTVEEAFELSNASAERSAAACTVDLSENAVKAWLQKSIETIRGLLADGYQSAPALESRVREMEKWLEKPELLRRDADAEYAQTIDIDCAKITEPVLALPNNPDSVGWLSAQSGRAVDEVFIGSCMTNLSHFREAAKLLKGKKIGVKRLWITPPTKLERAALEAEGVIQTFADAGARIEISGCSLCMGNQARVADNAVVFATSTRNFNERMGHGAQVYLGSARLAAVVALLGKIPTKEEYFALAGA